MTARRRRLDPFYDVLPAPGTLGVAIGIHVSTPRPPTADTRVTEPCACGSTITTEPDDESIELAVQTHQRTTEHRAYAVIEQLAGNFVAVHPLAQLWRIQMSRKVA